MSAGFTARIVALVAAILAACACGVNESRQDAEAFAERYFAARSASDLSAALAFYSPQFFADTPRDQWLTTLQDLRERCGTLTSHSLKNWMVTDQVGTQSGSTTTLTYEVNYASCRLQETMVVLRPEGGEDKIIRHVMKAEGEMPQNSNPAATTV